LGCSAAAASLGAGPASVCCGGSSSIGFGSAAAASTASLGCASFMGASRSPPCGGAGSSCRTALASGRHGGR
jgi:hypothetical protein